MKKLNVTPRQNVDADTSRWYREIAQASNVLRDPTGSSEVGFIQSGTGAVATTVESALRVRYSPTVGYGAVGDNVADETTALTNCWAACPAYGVIDLGGFTYRITSPIPRPAVGVEIRNGRIRLDNTASNAFYALVANDYCIFDGITFLGANVTGTAGTPKYQGGIFGGNTIYSAPMNTSPANYVTVRGCTFIDLTVGVWSGGASTDAVPVGWHVYNNNLINIVGYAGQSEGYGVLFTPSNNGIIHGNTFKTIRRHCIYLAGEASNNVVDGNIIDGVDNIAIQSNTGAAQNAADGNIFSNNVIRNLTRSIAYGYRSSIGIGIYGKVKNCHVSNNKVYGPLDTGIDTSGELSGTAYSDAITITSNDIFMDAASTDTGIRADGLLSGTISNNSVRLKGAIQGITITSTVSTSADVIDVRENTLITDTAGAIALRVDLDATRILKAFRNTLIGFTNALANRIYDTSSAGTVRTDLNRNTGYVSTDADFTHYSCGTVANTDCPTIRHAGVLTAARNITLSTTNVELGSELTVMRTGAGAFNLNLYDGGTVKALTTGTFATVVWNGSGWEEKGAGTL